MINTNNIKENTESERSLVSRKPMFGSLEQENLYKSVKTILVEQRILRLYEKSTIDNQTTITVCNLWRLNRLEGSLDIIIETRNIHTNEWSQVNTNSLFHLDLLPITSRMSGERAWMWIYEQAIVNIFAQLGRNARDDNSYKGVTSTNKIFKAIFKKYLPKFKKGKNGKPTKTEIGLINSKKLRMASRALVKNLWIAFIDRKALSLAATLKGFSNPLTLADYIDVLPHNDRLLTLKAEKPNLFRLLGTMHPDLWYRDDIFSRKLWVKNGRKTTVIDRETVYSSYDNPSVFNWLSKAPSSIVWMLMAPLSTYEIDRREENRIRIVEFFIRNKFERNIPVAIYSSIIKRFNRFLNHAAFGSLLRCDEGEVSHQSEQCERYLNILKCHLVTFWRDNGYAELRHYLSHSYIIDDLEDWLLLGGGFDSRQVHRNSTFWSLIKESDNWHEQTYNNYKHSNLAWKSLVGEDIIDSHTITPLCNSLELHNEGKRMHHCVSSFERLCYANRYRVFNIKVDASRFEYTLGIELKRNNKWSVQQIRGYANKGIPGQKTMDVVDKIVSLYNSAYKEEVKIKAHNL
ncbi:PcfJ domain-containing protein [Pseudomonas luteola]